MIQQSLVNLGAALARHRVRYLIVGGVAGNLHGHGRTTRDIDLVADLNPDNVARLFAGMADAGYRPGVPVTALQFGDPAQREVMIRDKGMVVLNFVPVHGSACTVDVFVREPFDFGEAWTTAMALGVGDGVTLPYADIPTLIATKVGTGRPKDEEDVRVLRMMLEDEGGRHASS